MTCFIDSQFLIIKLLFYTPYTRNYAPVGWNVRLLYGPYVHGFYRVTRPKCRRLHAAYTSERSLPAPLNSPRRCSGLRTRLRRFNARRRNVGFLLLFFFVLFFNYERRTRITSIYVRRRFNLAGRNSRCSEPRPTLRVQITCAVHGS